MRARRAWPRRWLPWIVSITLTAVIFAYLFSQIDPAELWRAARHLAPRPLAFYAVLALGGVLARAIRFWLLLGRTVGIGVLVAITLARNLFVDLLPARTGELSYVYLLTRRTGRSVEDGLATLLLAILFDIVALAPLLAVALVAVGGGLSGIPSGALLAGSILLALFAYVAIRLAEPISRGVAIRLDGGGAESLRTRAAARLRTLAHALSEARDRGVFLPVLAVSGIVRLCKFGSYYFLVEAIMGGLGESLAGLGFFRVFLGVVAAELAAALPIHGVAGFGTFEAVWAVSFVQLGFSREQAIITGILAHALSQIVEYSMGAAALLWLMRPGGRP